MDNIVFEKTVTLNLVWFLQLEMIGVGDAKNRCANPKQRLSYPFRSLNVKAFSCQHQVVDTLKCNPV